VRSFVIGSRGSRLALWQAEWVKARLLERGRPCSLKIIRTSGDKITDRPLAAFGGKGVFVKEIEDALIAGEIDLAVHSLKDLPTAQPEGLTICCVPAREDPHDLLASAHGVPPGGLKAGAVVGTGSPRRACQIRALRPDLSIRDLRGNVDTRLRKLREAGYDAIVLAVAGVRRLGEVVPGHVLSFAEMLPAVGQGALAIESRLDDAEIAAALEPIHHAPTAAAVTAERAFLRGLGGGCQAPIAAHGQVEDGRLLLQGLVAEPRGERLLRDRREGSAAEADRLGAALAAALLDRGAAALLAGTPAPVAPFRPPARRP